MTPLSYIFNQAAFNRFFFFLGTNGGELVKRSVEMIFLVTILYMLLSEYKKHKKEHYKYLILGFTSYLFRHVVISTILFNHIFGDYKFTRFNVLIVFLDNYLEILALVLLVFAFIYPGFKGRIIQLNKIILTFLVSITIVIGLVYIFQKIGITSHIQDLIVLLVIKVIVLIIPLALIVLGKLGSVNYKKSIVLAFLIYMIIPISSLLGLTVLSNIVYQKILVFQHPFPVIAILLFMRTVYLSLVDKAYLEKKILQTEEKVKHQQELNKLKDYFISLVSHEIRTPVTSMKLYLSLLISGKFGKLSRKQKTAINTIIGENNRLSDLVSDLLTLNRYESKKVSLTKTRFNFNKIVDNIYLEHAKNKGIKVIKNISSDLKVYGDKDKLKQVFVNLFNNAVKFSRPGKRIWIKAEGNDQKFTFCIKDEGIGIQEENISKVFDKFFQIENVMTRKNQGIGLGLSIVKMIIELHGGEIKVKSHEGKGSEFRVDLPMR